MKHLKSTETFDSVYTSNNPNTAWQNLKGILQKTFDSKASFITKKVKGKKTPWLTRELKHEINRRYILQRKLRKSKSITDLENFWRQRNRVNILVRKAKNSHSKKILKKSANDPNRFWKTIKTIYPTKVKETITKTIFIGERITTNAKETASHFCTFFSNIASSLKRTAAPLKDFIWSKPRKSHPNTYSTFGFREVRVNEVFKCLKKLSRKKACGPDDLPPGMLKDCALEIAKPFCQVINISIKKRTRSRRFQIRNCYSNLQIRF